MELTKEQINILKEICNKPKDFIFIEGRRIGKSWLNKKLREFYNNGNT